MRRLLLLLCSIAPRLFSADLTRSEIEALAKEPPSADVIEELKIYPVCDDMTFTMAVTMPNGSVTAPMQEKAREWYVQGKYLVVKVSTREGLYRYHVKTYDRQNRLYRGWDLLPDGMVIATSGIYDADHHIMSWQGKSIEGTVKASFMAIQRFVSDKRNEWMTNIYIDDAFVYTINASCDFKGPPP